MNKERLDQMLEGIATRVFVFGFMSIATEYFFKDNFALNH